MVDRCWQARVGFSCAGVLGATLVTLLLCVSAHAETPTAKEMARDHFTRAEAHFAKGEFAAALSGYQAAHGFDPLPAFLFNIGLCYRNLKDYPQARRYLRAYLAKVPDPPNRRVVEKLLKEAEALAGTSVEDDPPPPSSGGDIPAASQPTPAVPPPPEPTAPRAATARPAPDPSSAAAQVHQQAAVVAGEAKPGSPSPSPPPPDSLLTPRVLLWSGVGLTAALLLTGTITGQLASNRSAEYRDPQTPYAELSGLRDSARAMATTSIVTFAAGAAAGVGTALYYWLGYRRPAEVSVAVAPAPSGGTLFISWTR